MSDKSTREKSGLGTAQPKSKQKNDPSSNTNSQQLVTRTRMAVIVVIVAFLVGIYFWYSKHYRVYAFKKAIVELQSSFTNQTDRFWRIINNRGLAHLNNASPHQPFVLLLAAPPAAHRMVDCFAKKLAEGLDPQYKRMLAKIDGREERSYPGEETKKKMDDLLIRSFKKGHRAALVHHLELLPLPSPLLFYSYCDDQNAPHKDVAIIFTVHMPEEPDASLEPREAEGTVEKYLTETVWAKEDKDAVAALLSRVADTVALMNGEPISLDAC